MEVEVVETLVFDILTFAVMIEIALCLLFAMLGCMMFFIYLGKITYDWMRGEKS